MLRKLVALAALFVSLPSIAATAWVTEFTGAPPDSVYYQAVRAPALAKQTVVVGGGSLQSSLFQYSTGIVRVACDVACLVEIGTNPTAAGSSMRLAAGGVEYFVVPIGGTYRVAVIAAPAP